MSIQTVQTGSVGVMGADGRIVLNKLGLKAGIEFGISRSAASPSQEA